MPSMPTRNASAGCGHQVGSVLILQGHVAWDGNEVTRKLNMGDSPTHYLQLLRFTRDYEVLVILLGFFIPHIYLP